MLSSWLHCCSKDLTASVATIADQVCDKVHSDCTKMLYSCPAQATTTSRNALLKVLHHNSYLVSYLLADQLSKCK